MKLLHILETDYLLKKKSVLVMQYLIDRQKKRNYIFFSCNFFLSFWLLNTKYANLIKFRYCWIRSKSFKNLIEIFSEFQLSTMCKKSLTIKQPKILKPDALKQLSLFLHCKVLLSHIFNVLIEKRGKRWGICDWLKNVQCKIYDMITILNTPV